GGPKSYRPMYDGNGNVTGLIDLSDNSVAATYEYDPFGNLLNSSGPAADINPFRFSTKYWDGEINKYRYEQGNYYDQVKGRRMGRDPGGEGASLDLYVPFHNDPINKIDPLGFDATWTPAQHVEYHRSQASLFHKNAQYQWDLFKQTGNTQ